MKAFPVVWGIPVLAINPEYYYCPLPREWFRTLLRNYNHRISAGSQAYLELLRKVVGAIADNERKNEWIDNLVDESRAYFRLLTTIGPTQHVLNLGCGWDNTTISLSRFAQSVTAMDLTLERLQLIALKARYYGIQNIDLICGGDGHYLPFSDHTFDLVCLNGVLEWVAASTWKADSDPSKNLFEKLNRAWRYLKAVYTDHRPFAIQQAFLQEVCRVLRPGGQLWLAIENRYGRQYFFRQPDDHSQLWFGSLYPRILAHFVSLWKNHKPYLTFTHSRRGYRRLLSKAGLSPEAWHAVEPEYRNPVTVVNLLSRREIQAFKDRTTNVARHVPAWLYGSTAPAFGILARKAGQGSRSIIDNILRRFGEILAEHGLSAGEYHVQSFQVTRKEKILIRLASSSDECDAIILRVPMTPAAEDMARRHVSGLERIRNSLTESTSGVQLVRLLPRTVAHFECCGQVVFAETCLRGRPIAEIVSRSCGQTLITSIASLIREFTLNCRAAPQSLDAWRSRTKEKISFLGSILRSDDYGGTVQRKLDWLADRLLTAAGSEDGLYVHKGDFTVANILVHCERVTGIVDFDEWQETGLSLTSLLEFYLSLARTKFGHSWCDVLPSLVLGEFAALRKELSVWDTFAGLNASDVPVGFAAIEAWLNHVVYALRRQRMRLNRRWVGDVIIKVLAQMDVG